MDHYLIPKGYSDFIPSESQQKSDILSTLADIYTNYQFSLISTPTVELVSSLETAMTPNLLQQSVKFRDAFGQHVVLRPDHTVPIARIVASRMTNDTLPLKLFYQSPIFRQPLKNATSRDAADIEQFQSGLEIIGDASIHAELSLLQVCVSALRALNITNIHIDIGHTDFIKALSPALQQSLIEGDYLALGYIPERGGRHLVANHPQLSALSDQLEALKLDAMVSYNQGLVKGIHYYTGTLFEIYTKDTKRVIATGGRYDALLKSFGFDQPAVGLAFNVSELMEYVS
jgi:ATP phosphoribosyltransferase regulatory subunit